MIAWIVYDFSADRILASQGDLGQTFAPQSTFKVPLALISYETGILTDTVTPKWDYEEKFQSDIPIMLDQWKEAHDPKLWIKNSCVWYSQEITRRLGIEKLKFYIDRFEYGNCDVSGDPGKNNGLVRSWLTSSLQISPLQQIDFVKKILSSSLPISNNTVRLTSELIQDDGDGLDGHVFAKTGSGFVDRERGLQKGWYIGWMEQEKQKVIFACLREHSGYGFAGLEARKFMRSTILNQI